ncbi:MAG: hypothetical protein R2698_02060 [Microthrixaceae bacterium]
MSRPRRSTRASSKKDKAAPRDFWGSHESVPDLVNDITPARDASAIVRSAGSPPLVGHEVISEHYFRAIYDRAAALATAVAAGSGLLAEDDDDRSGLPGGHTP